ncbi:MAG: glutamyl-tRNA amidotransferase [Flavobacteriaceae bacterium]|nr:MAG: glutamyl-tRNA amidotransferase [Flavobacteriaceae bacterium]
MNLEENIMAELKTAMKNKDKVALEALRAVKSAILMAKTAGGKETALSAEAEISILQKQIKQRKESAEQFSAQDRKEMAELELAQAAVIEKFLPKQLTENEIEEILGSIIAETGAIGMKDMGKVMGLASEKMAGKADGKTISTLVKKLLG